MVSNGSVKICSVSGLPLTSLNGIGKAVQTRRPLRMAWRVQLQCLLIVFNGRVKFRAVSGLLTASDNGEREVFET